MVEIKLYVLFHKTDSNTYTCGYIYSSPLSNTSSFNDYYYPEVDFEYSLCEFLILNTVIRLIQEND